MTEIERSESGWSPDWATHPGEHLLERIEVHGWSQAEFARRAGLTGKLVSEIITGKNPVTPDTAIKLEHVLGLKDYIWLGIQADWDLHQLKQHQRTKLDKQREVAQRFPLKELKARNVLPKTDDLGALVDGLLSFLGIGSLEAWRSAYGCFAVQHREAKAHASTYEHLFAWLTVGEHRAREMNLPEFDSKKFAHAVAEARSLTCEGVEVFLPKLTGLCQAAGVALICEPPFPKVAVYGSARWVDGDTRAIIQLSLRAKSNDHFWWTFFHECGHITLHRGKSFADDLYASGSKAEDEANAYAERVLYGQGGAGPVLDRATRSVQGVCMLAEELGLHPGILVGLFQHHELLSHKFMNGLKDRFAWRE